MLGVRRRLAHGLSSVLQARLLILLHFDLPCEVVEVFLVHDPVLVLRQKREDQLVEENPLMLEK